MSNLKDSLPDLMRRATEHLEPSSTDLVERGMRRGVTLRRRRTALLSFSGAGAVLATAGIVIGGSQLFNGNGSAEAPVAGTPGASAQSAQSAQSGKPAGQAETLATLQNLLPADLKQTKPHTWGFDGFNGASVIVDDGKGASLVTATVQTINYKKTCADVGVRNCKIQADGSVLVSYSDEPVYPNGGNPGGVITNRVELYRPDGSNVNLMSLNGPQEKDAEHTRPKPLFSVAQLTKLADSELWGFPPKQSVPTPTGGPVSIQAKPPIVPLPTTLATLKKVLPGTPQLIKPNTWGGGNEGFNGAAYVINDGKGASRVDVFLTTDAAVSKCPPEGLQHCTVRSDGSVLSWSKDAPTYADERNSIEGVLSNVITINYPDGRSISMTSYNAPQEKGSKHTRVKPAYTTDQLTAMADSKLWKFPGGRSATK
jgi:hypothetical protein